MIASLIMLVAVAASADDAALAAQVRAVMQAKCYECHGDHLGKPKGEFGYVMDLARMAANPELVVKGKPDDSELFITIDEREMPPKKAKGGPMSDEQIALVKQWIEAGAPAPPQVLTSLTPPAPAPQAPFSDRLMQWIGKFHPLSVHFPIALLLAAGLAEIMVKLTGKPQYELAVRFCVFVGAIGAVIAAALGWTHAIYAGYSGETLFRHRWLGVGTAVWSVICVVLVLRTSNNRKFLRWALLIAALLVGAAGHFGGMLTYGPNHYNW